MDSIAPADLVRLLRGARLRVRTGIWLLPQELLGQEPDEAARLSMDAVDLCRELLDDLPQGTRYSGLSASRIIELLDRVSGRDRGSSCVLVYNLDLLLARLRRDERSEVWQMLYDGFAHRTRALLVAMPSRADSLLPVHSLLNAWRRDGRLSQTS